HHYRKRKAVGGCQSPVCLGTPNGNGLPFARYLTAPRQNNEWARHGGRWRVIARRAFQKSDRASLNNSNAMKAAHAALAIRPIGMVATTSAFRTIHIPRSWRAPAGKMRPGS